MKKIEAIIKPFKLDEVREGFAGKNKKIDRRGAVSALL